MTRAEPGAARTAARLRDRGFEPMVRPVLRIETLPIASPNSAPDGLVFTSRNGVAAWAGMTDDRDLPVVAVGAATAEAARAAGFRSVRSADGDIVALAALIRSDPALAGRTLLHPGAETPAGDLPALVGGHARVESLPVYRAVETGASPPEGVDALLVHSPRAARAIAERWIDRPASPRIACAISPAAAEPLEGLDLKEIRVAASPDETALLACLGKPPGAV